MGNAGDFLTAMASGVDLAVEVRSAHGPWFTLDAGEAPAPVASATPAEPPKAGGWSFKKWLMGWLRPEVIVRSSLGTFSKAPGGSPTFTTWPLVPIVLGVFSLLVFALAVVGVRSLLRRK